MVIALQVPAVQNLITGKAVNFLEEKIGTRVELGSVKIGFPKSIVINELYLEDQKKDTLLYANRLAINIDMIGLMNSEIQVNGIEMESMTAHIYRTLPDSTFNFDYIIDAFASEEVEKDTTASEWDFSLYELELRDIYLTYADEVTGDDVNLKLGEFTLEMDEFNLNENKFHIDLIALNDTKLRFIQSKETPEMKEEEKPKEEAPDAFNYDVALNKFTVNNVDLNYKNVVSAQQFIFAIGEFVVTGDEINLPGQSIALNKVGLHDSDLQIILNENIEVDSVAKKVEETVSEKEGEEDGSRMAFFFNELNLSGNQVRFNNYNEPKLASGVDFNHMNLSALNVLVEDFEFHDETIKADIQQFAFKEQSGFKLEKLSTKVDVDSTSAEVKNLELRTGESIIKNSLVLKYPSLTSIQDDLGKIIVDMDMNAEIGFQDIAYLQPDLAASPPFAGNLDKKIYVDSKLQGPVNNLTIQGLNAKALNATALSMTGNVRGLPETENLYLDINLKNFSSTRGDLMGILPPAALPDSFNLPGSASISANYKGTLDDFDVNAALKTSLGDLNTEISMRNFQSKARYTGQLNVQELQVGTLIGQQETMGALTLQANVDGVGLSLEEINTQLKAVVLKMEYNDYEYNDLTVEGKIEQKQFVGKAGMDDKNLQFAFDGNINFNKETPVMDFLFDLQHVNLKALNFMKDEMTAKFIVEADISGVDLNDINGDFGIRDVTIVREGERYSVNSLMFGSIQEKRKTEIKVESELFSARLDGTVNLGDLAPTITRHINRYYKLHDEEVEENLEPQNFDFEIVIHDTDLLTNVLVPSLETFIPGDINGNYNSETMKLEVNVSFPKIVYNTTTVDGLAFNIDSNSERLDYSLNIDQVLDSSFHIQNLGIFGEVEDNLINTWLQLLDEEEKEKYLLGGTFRSLDDAYRFSFEPDKVILNYDVWNVPENHFLQFGPEGFVASNVALTRGNNALSINTLENKDLEVAFDTFNLSLISKMIEREENLISGELNGNFVLDNQQEAFAFKADLGIDSFSFKEDTLGNITLKASNPVANQYDVNLGISGSGNQMSVDGNYITPEEANAPGIIDFNINLEALNLSTVEAYTAGQLENLKGNLTGQLKATGTTEDPQIRGQLNFQEASFLLTMLNNSFTLKDEKIEFDESGIQFPDFRMIDAYNNVAVVTGSVLTKTYTDFDFALDIKTRNFRVISTTEEDNELYYGNLVMDTDLRIRGNMDLPEIEGSLMVKKGSDMTLVIPTGEAGIAEMEGIVRFVDMSLDNPYAHLDTASAVSDFEGINLNTVIRTEKEARFTVLMDPSGTDALSIRGEADLNLSINPAGDMTLTGRYEIAEGSYQLAFMGVVNRRFSINPGSTIVWNGDVMDATLDIRAIYNVRTSPINLLEGRVPGEPPPQARQQFPFMVYLNMEGELMNPLISFGLDMPEDQRGAAGNTVYPIIQDLNQEQQVAELNKQVFALLVLNTFIAPDPLSGGGGGGVEGAARKSVSNLLSQQLNKMADRYISGFDLNIGLESYDEYSDSGEASGRTELQVGVSRQFLDNRLTVQVGSNIDVEGEKASQQSGVSDIAGNVSVEYNLTEDGRYRLKAYREQTYESIIDGELIETGLGLIFTRDYNRLRDLFRKSRRERMNEDAIKETDTTREQRGVPSKGANR